MPDIIIQFKGTDILSKTPEGKPEYYLEYHIDGDTAGLIDMLKAVMIQNSGFKNFCLIAAYAIEGDKLHNTINSLKNTSHEYF